MSLLNDVLKQLDGRPAARAGGGPPGPLPPRRRRRAPRIVAALLLCLATGYTAVRLALRDAPVADVAPVSAGEARDPDVAPPTAPAPEAAPAEPARGELRGLAVESRARGARLRFALAGPARHELVAEGAKVQVIFENTRLPAPLPALDLAATPVQLLDTRQVSDEVWVSLQLEPGTRVQSAVIEHASGSELLLDLSAPGPAPGAEAAAPADGGAYSETVVAHDAPRAELRRERSSADAHYREALELERVGRPRAALDALRRALERAPDHHATRVAAVRLLAASGDAAGAQALLDAGLARAPGHREFALQKARLLAERGAFGAGAELLAANAPPLERDPEYHAYRAGLLQRAGEHARAAQLYGAALQFDAGRAAWWLGLGISLDAQGGREKARLAFERALALGELDAASAEWVAGRIARLRAEP